MIYLEGFMTLQMGHMGRYKGVYNTSEGLYGTHDMLGGFNGTSEGVIGAIGGGSKTFRGVDGTSEGIYGMIRQSFSLIWGGLLHSRSDIWDDRRVFMTYMKGFMVFQRGQLG